MITRDSLEVLPPPGSYGRAYAGKRPGEEEIDVRALLSTLLDRKWLIIGVTATFLILSLLYVLVAPPVYQASAMVQVQQAPNVTGPNAVPQTFYSPNNPAAADALSLLTSRSVVKKAVDDFKLNIVTAPNRFPVLGNIIARHYATSSPGKLASPWLWFDSYDWGGAKLEFDRLEVPNSLLGEDLTLVAGDNGSYTLWDESIIPGESKLLLQGKVGQTVKGSGITALVKTLRANPGTKFDVVRNGETFAVDQWAGAVQVQQPGKMDSNVIQVSLNSTNPGMAVKILDQITRAYVTQNSSRNSAQAASGLEFVQKQLPIVKGRLEKAQDELNAFQVKAHSVDVGMQTQALLNQITNIDTSIQQLETQKPEVARLYTPNHPAYQAIQKQIGQLQAQKADMQKQLGTLPDTQRELLRLTGNVQVLNTTYTNLLSQEQQLELAQAGTVGDVRIVDPAAVDITTPIKPKKAITVLGATFVGAFFAVCYVFLRRMLNRRLEDPFQIEQLGLPVYASIPLSEEERSISKRRLPFRYRPEPRRLLALTAPADYATEALRGLRTSLAFAQREARNNLLMVSGASPDAGKTFISANLATVMAQSGKRVLLVDANLRDGSLHEVLGSRTDNGLSELLTGRIELSEAVRQIVGLETLHFIPRGRVPAYPSELLMNHRFTSLLQRLSGDYDLVILDSPPILAVTDAAVIGRHVGTNLLVVRFGLNESREVELAKQRFEHSGVPIHGVVFNAVEPRNGSTLEYDYYGYAEAAK